MNVVRYLKLASVLIGLNLVVSFSSSSSRAEEVSLPAASDGAEITTRGEAKRTVIRSRVDVLELRGARRNPNFLEESFHAVEVSDTDRWNHQHDYITPVKGLRHHSKSRMPASVIAKQTVKTAKAQDNQNVAMRK